MKRRVVVSMAAGIAMIALLVFWRGFFIEHAVLTGIAVMALVYSIQRAADRMRDLYRR